MNQGSRSKTIGLVIGLISIAVLLLCFEWSSKNQEKVEESFTPPDAPKKSQELKVLPSNSHQPDGDALSEPIRPLS